MKTTMKIPLAWNLQDLRISEGGGPSYEIRLQTKLIAKK